MCVDDRMGLCSLPGMCVDDCMGLPGGGHAYVLMIVWAVLASIGASELSLAYQSAIVLCKVPVLYTTHF